MIHLKESKVDYKFLCTKYKTIEIEVAFVRYTFEDENKKTFLVYNTTSKPNRYVLKEYEGALSERRYWCVFDENIYKVVYGLLLQLCDQRIVLCVN